MKKLIKELTLKSQQRFRSKKRNVFTEEVNKITLSANDNKGIQSIDSTETYASGTSKVLVCKKGKIKFNIVIKNPEKN